MQAAVAPRILRHPLQPCQGWLEGIAPLETIAAAVAQDATERNGYGTASFRLICASDSQNLKHSVLLVLESGGTAITDAVAVAAADVNAL